MKGKPKCREFTQANGSKLQANWEIIIVRSEMPMDYTGVQKLPGMGEFLSKQWGGRASFLPALSTGRTDHWEGGHECQRACWSLEDGKVRMDGV